MKTGVPYEQIDRRSRPILERCCFVVPLRVGCFILGYINLILSMFSIAVIVFATTVLSDQSLGNIGQGLPPQIGDDIPFDSVSVTDPSFISLRALLVVCMIGKVIWLGVLILCLVGLHKKYPGHIELYVVFATVRVILGLLVLSVIVVGTDVEFEGMLTNLIDLLLSAYFIIVYKSYATQLKNEIQSTPSVFQITSPDITFIQPTKLEKEVETMNKY